MNEARTGQGRHHVMAALNYSRLYRYGTLGRLSTQAWASTASSSRAMMLVILIAGFTAGPAVSL